MSEGCIGAGCTSIRSSPASGCRGPRETRLTESPGSPNLVSCNVCTRSVGCIDSRIASFLVGGSCSRAGAEDIHGDDQGGTDDGPGAGREQRAGPAAAVG